MKSILTIVVIVIIPFTLINCSSFKRYGWFRDDEKLENGIWISLVNDYQFKDIENAIHFSNSRLFISGLITEDRYCYYIFWPNGRCLFSDAKKAFDITLGSILYNNRSGTAGYYKIEGDSVITERFSSGVYLYEYYVMTENKLTQIEFKGRKPYRNRMYRIGMTYPFIFEERYTRPDADSVYFNSDSVALWQPFW